MATNNNAPESGGKEFFLLPLGDVSPTPVGGGGLPIQTGENHSVFGIFFSRNGIMAQTLWTKRNIVRIAATLGLVVLCGVAQPAWAHHRGGGGGGAGGGGGGGGGGGKCGGGGGGSGGTTTAGTTTGGTTTGTGTATNTAAANSAALQAYNAYNPNALGQTVMQQVRLQQVANQQRAMARRAQTIQQTQFVASVRSQMSRSDDPEAIAASGEGSVRPWLLQQRRLQYEALQDRKRESRALLANHGDR